MTRMSSLEIKHELKKNEHQATTIIGRVQLLQLKNFIKVSPYKNQLKKKKYAHRLHVIA